MVQAEALALHVPSGHSTEGELQGSVIAAQAVGVDLQLPSKAHLYGDVNGQPTSFLQALWSVVHVWSGQRYGVALSHPLESLVKLSQEPEPGERQAPFALHFAQPVGQPVVMSMHVVPSVAHSPVSQRNGVSLGQVVPIKHLPTARHVPSLHRSGYSAVHG